jgi:beta-mannosidase
MQVTDGWRAAAADDHLRRSYTERDFDDSAWHPVAVPGHWRSTPAFAGADGPLLYRGRFPAPAPAAGRRAWLTFEGLFYQGDVWLDGGYLGDTEGWFAPHSFEVTEALAAASEHVLAVEVTCSPVVDPRAKRNLTGVFQSGDHVDPAWNPGGIWRPVRLHETGPVRLAALRVVCREASAERAVLALRAVLDSDAARHVRLRTEVGGHDHEQDQPLAAGTNEVNWTVTVDRPALWWPRALGDPVLHDARVAVLVPGAAVGGDPAGDGEALVSDERRLRTGLRAVRLRRWVWSVNGERLFVKGAVHGPTRQALAEATAAEVRADVEAAVDLGLDLLRVHAHVARPELYDAADEAGLLLWQDMPLHGPYARGLRRQAARQAGALVDLLGHHPSVALWCGHDQPRLRDGTGPGEPAAVAGDAVAGALRAALADQVPTWNRSVLDGSVKRALQGADGSRPVLAQSGVAPHPPTFDGADAQLWLGWLEGDERDLPGLARAVPRLVRFVSAFGAQAVPSGDVAFAAPDRWPDLDWEALAAHHGLQAAVLAARVPPSAFPTFAAWRHATQDYQATVVRRQVEELRRLKYRPAGGFAVSRLADAHPGITTALLDHERRPKAAYAALQAACRPVIVVADRLPAAVTPGEALALDVHVVSDRREAVIGAEATATLAWSGGEHRWHWRGDVGPDACVRVATLQVVVPDAAGTLDLDLRLTLPRGGVVTNRYEAALVQRPR